MKNEYIYFVICKYHSYISNSCVVMGNIPQHLTYLHILHLILCILVIAVDSYSKAIFS